MAGKTPKKAWDNVRENLWPVLLANWSLWPIFHVRKTLHNYNLCKISFFPAVVVAYIIAGEF